MSERTVQRTFGPNEWLVDEIYERYQADPSSVSDSWRDFFADYQPRGGNGSIVEARHGADSSAVPAGDRPEPSGDGSTPEKPQRLVGPAAAIARNMAQSLEVPTATSARVAPAKLLEVNRKIINDYLGRAGSGKVSFTHLIGYAIVKALGQMPVMNSSYTEVDGKPAVIRHAHVGLGLAVDVEKPDGSHTLLVPVIKDADALDFRGFWLTYEELVRKVRNRQIAVADMSGATVSLTNPGTIGTVHSVPRLMEGQGVIVGVGAIGYPAEYQAADPALLAKLGVSKVLTITSTYDHRIIQGAESGLFLQYVHHLLVGEHTFYDDVFQSIGVPQAPVRWQHDLNPLDSESAQGRKQAHVQGLINMYRVRGHLIADLDPLRCKEPGMEPELDPTNLGLTIWDLDRTFFVDGVAGHDILSLGDVLGVMRDAYTRSIGVEYMHIQDPAQKKWIQEHVEGVPTIVNRDEVHHILERLNAAESFEKFLGTKYVGHKRFGLDGAESAIAIIDAILGAAADDGLDSAMIGMAHRGRLNVLANIVGKPAAEIFREFDGDIDPHAPFGSGDVKYHKGAEGTFVSRNGNELPLRLASNPSHLEAVDAVVEGMARARQDQIERPEPFSVLPLLIHGDAAFAGQGVAAEALNLSALRGYRTGGTVHLVINNQVGFTTAPAKARSTVYPTDVAKMVQAPIFHVNGDDPEACVRVARLAYEFRQAFHKDAVIDMWCYRRFGHSEGDEPSYTQPLMYRRIENRPSVRKLYTEMLVNRGDSTVEQAESALQDFHDRLQNAFEDSRSSAAPGSGRARTAAQPLGARPHLDTGAQKATLDRIADVRFHPPDGFHIHPKLAKQLSTHEKMYREGQVDWALAEVLAFGSLLLEGTDIRLAGQDTRRGTFSQRHSVLVDYENEREWTPLSDLDDGCGKFRVYDSMLSEYAALGFEYGYSAVNKNALVVWEAQFGDFANGAQVLIDQFIASGEDKWGQTSGLTLLLPHGYEGQGPEHSSARIERYLALCAGDNMQVVNATTSAQYFHVLRRQVCGDIRRPLVIFTPKSLLRARAARSPVADLTVGSFQPVLDDRSAPAPDSVRRILLASGKVAYDVMNHRDSEKAPVAIIRVEQLYPWPGEQLATLMSRYDRASDVVWVQEEPENMGPWTFVRTRIERLLGPRYLFRVASRAESASPATGNLTTHKQEQVNLIEDAFAGI